MSIPVISIPTRKLLQLGLQTTNNLNYQLTAEELVQDTLREGDGWLSDSGALVVHTGKFTGRSPKDRFIVKDELTADSVDWNEFNNPIDEQYYQAIFKKIITYLNERKELWIRDAYACADENFRLNIRVVAENPWTSLFVYNMFLRPDEEELESFLPHWHILSAPGLKLDPSTCGTRQENATVISLKNRMILVAGTGYTGETKKAVFSVLNYLLPNAGVLSMHCAANVGRKGDTAIFFGLSGTGKTTLSADPSRQLIGDDEHGWNEDGVFNFEGGCYAKTIDLKKDKEPEIFNAVRPGALVENIAFFPGTNTINFSDRSITENTRVSYPIHFINNALHPSVGGAPENIFFLTCDAYGVLPPISKLSVEQAMYQFISGYTAKVAGTETGITEPKSTFSACFGAPFMPLHPGKYAELLGEKIRRHHVTIWLVNTGWTGGSFGKGKRIDLSHTRAMIAAALDGHLKEVKYEEDPVFRIAVPTTCPGVPQDILNPRNTWEDKTAYDEAAKKLAALFISNFEKYAEGVSREVISAAPKC
jgi:phosphoenolpyruvate carboxykinase (ATP)